MSRYAIIANLEEQRASYKLDDLPLHVTLIGIFRSSKPAGDFETIIRDIASNHRATIVRAIGRENFGKHQKVLVTELDYSEELQTLHQNLLRDLSDHLEHTDNNFEPENYRPHVTDQNGRSVEVDTRIMIDNLTFVQIKSDNVSVGFRYDLEPSK